MSTIIQQGTFVSTGGPQVISVRSDIDWFKTFNFTQLGLQQTPGRTVETFWQRGMAAATGTQVQKLNGVDTVGFAQLSAPNGFTLLDTSVENLGPSLVHTAISTAFPPVVTTASTASLSDGDVIRIFNTTNAQQLGGYDFTIDVLTGTTFELSFMGAIALAGTNGTFVRVSNGPKYTPQRRSITGVAVGTTTTIAMSVVGGYTVGQQVRVKIPAEFGTVELDNRIGTITEIQLDLATNLNTITLDIDSTGFTTFTFPATAAVPFTPAQIIPVGEAAAEPFSNLLDDATINTALLGIEFPGGILTPAGSLGDLVFWQAGKSFSVTNA